MVTQIRQLKEAGKEDMKANEKMSLRKKKTRKMHDYVCTLKNKWTNFLRLLNDYWLDLSKV